MLAFSILHSQPIQVIESDSKLSIIINKSKLASKNKNDTSNFEILFTALKNQKFTVTSSNDFLDYRIKYSYDYRELPIYTINIKKNSKYLNIQNDVKIDIQFDNGKEIPLLNLKLNNAESSLYSPFINKKHIASLLNSNTSKKENKIQVNEGWYNSSFEYIMLTTKRDGVAKVTLNDIINLLPDLDKQQYKYLHLKYKGNDYPIYFKSLDTLIDASDELYFLGRMVHSDSTWLDYYSDESKFYLYLDTTLENTQKLILFEKINTQNEIKLVNFKEHYEKDKTYGWINSINSETAINEGWYEKEINGSTDLPITITSSLDSYINYHNLDFSSNIEDSLKIKMRIAITNEGNSNVKMFSKHSLYFNNQLLLNGSLTNQEERTLSTTLPATLLNSGINKIVLHTPFIDFSRSKDSIQGYTSVDYLEFEGKSKPNAYYGKLNFELDNQNNDNFINLNGFNTQIIVIIDSLNKQIGFENGNSGALIRLGGFEVNNQSQVSLSINDSNYFSDKVGFHLGTFDSQKNIYKFTYYKDGDILLSALNELSINDVFLVLINKSQNISNNLKSKLMELGSKAINQIDNNDFYSFCKFQSDISSIYEEKNSNNINVSKFISYIGGKSYSAKFQFVKSKALKIFSNDELSIELPKIEKVRKSNLLKDTNQADLIVITHDSVINSATKYANYRALKNGVKAIVVNVDDIYKEFNYGQKSALAIKSFLSYAYNNWRKPSLSFVAIWGDASIDCRKVVEGTKTTDLVPSYGLPASDAWYSFLNSNNKDYDAKFVISRIPAYNESTGYDYLDKIKEYEINEVKPWKKKYLSISAGSDKVTAEEFYKYSQVYSNYFIDENFCAEVVIVKKLDPNYIENSEATRIRNELNNGAFWTTYIGHGSPSQLELDGWRPEELNNPGKYGVLATVSCNTSSFAEWAFNWARNEEYVMTPKKGFISAIGSSSTGIIDVDLLLMSRIFYYLTNEESLNNNVGVLLNLAKSGLSNDIISLGAKYQYTLIGDPMINLSFKLGSDIYIDKNNYAIHNENGNLELNENDTICNLKFVLNNNGFKEQNKFRLIGRHTYNNIVEDYFNEIDGVCLNTPVSYNINIKNKVGDHKFEVFIDSEKVTKDYNRENNYSEFSFSVFSNALLKLDPQEYWDINPIEPEFRLIDNRVNYENKEYELVISDFITNDKVVTANYLDIEFNENYINWKPKIKLLNNRKYTLSGRYKDKITQNYSAWIKIPFWTNDKNKLNQALLLLNIFDEDQVVERQFVKIDSINKNLKLTNFELKVSLESIGGNAKYTKYNKMEVTPVDSLFKTRVFINKQYQDGIHIVVINSQDRFKLPVYRWFQTDYQINPKVDTANYASSRMNMFLKDSIADDDYVLFTCSSYSVNMFNFPPIKGDSLQGRDILLRELKRFGAKMADSLRFWPSYCLIGRRSNPEEAIEKYKEYEPVKIDTIINVYDKKGNFVTKSFGPAKRFSKLTLEGNLNTEKVKVKLSVIGIKGNGSIDTISTTLTNVIDFDLSSINTNIYRYLKFYFEIEKLNEKANPIVQNIKVEFTPLDEIAIVKKLTKVSNDSIERGYDFKIKAGFQNISPRVIAESSKLSIDHISNQSTTQNEYTFLNIEPNKIILFDSTINSIDFDNDNIFKYSLTSGILQNEYYKFNNNYLDNLYVANDIVKPKLILYIDSLNVKPMDYIQQNPTVTIELYDSSPIDLKDSNSIFLRINRYPIKTSNTKIYDLELFKNKSELKAKLTLKLDSLLDYGENVFTVIAKDASGNRADTIDIYLLVSNSFQFNDIIQFPNPFISNTKFTLNFKSSIKEVPCKVDIYNLTGSKIRTINSNLKLGQNSIYFDGNDDARNTIIAGIYVYKIYLDSENYAEPIIGKFVKID